MKKLIFVIFLLAFSNLVIAQQYFLEDTQCATDEISSQNNGNLFRGGHLKPHKSDVGGAPSGSDYFPILIVLVQFDDDGPDNSGLNIWPEGDPPSYMDELITNQRQSGSSWWDLYNGYDVSDFWHESSRGKFHTLGNAYSIVLPNTESWYLQNYPVKIDRVEKINKDIYERLKLQISGLNWEFYDKWTNSSPGSTNGSFTWGRDGKLDMMYVVFRNRQDGTLYYDAAGWVPLFGAKDQTNDGYLIYQNQSQAYNLYVDGNHSEDGSGLVVTGRGGPCTKEQFMEIMSHEHGHYLFGSGHTTCSKMAKGQGREFSLSPWEMIKLEYILPKSVNYSSPVHYLGDYSSRGGGAGTTGEVLQIPINSSGNGEFFLLANRRKVSQWDRRMSGDTLANDPANYINPGVNSEYGKGLYIYHIRNGYEYAWADYSNSDMECADGLWNWEQTGHSTPIWYQGTNLLHPTFRRVSPSYGNDNINVVTTCNNRDAMSLSCNATSLHPIHGWRTLPSQTWYSVGKSHQYTNPPISGTDRVFTNEEDYWYSLEFYGDRWDAWNVGYNEIFSPWSSPNTKDQFTPNLQTGIYIWHKALNSSTNEATLEIYRVGENDETELSILQKTPPSRPMGLKIEEHHTGFKCNPKLVWNHNMEPDMSWSDPMKEEAPAVKTYIVYKATYPTTGAVPYIYRQIAVVNSDPASTPYYIDDSTDMYNCSLNEPNPLLGPYVVRYKIKAVDKYNDHSVFSDFTQTLGTPIGSGGPIEDPPRPGHENDIPTVFDLKQKFPKSIQSVNKYSI